MILHRWIQGIRMFCYKCQSDQQGMLVIENDPKTGLTVGLSVECTKCKSELVDWEFNKSLQPSKQSELPQ